MAEASSDGGGTTPARGERQDGFCHGRRVEVPGALAGPLAGLRFAAKDNFDVAGHTSGAGNPDWLRTHEPAEATATAVQKLLDAGAALAGKTIMDELAFGSIGENRHYGTPVNPAAPGRVPGGSSSGSASVVAGGAVDFALGTDSACSVRLPASVCGLYGMRPTHGRVAIDGVIPLSPSLDTVGWMSRSAALLSLVGRVLLEPGRHDAPLTRLRIARDAFALAREPVRVALEAGVDRVRRRFAKIDHVDIGEPGTDQALGFFLTHSMNVQVREVWECHGAWIEEVRPDSVVLSRENMVVGAESTDEDMRQARSAWDALRARVQACVLPGSVLCLPTVTDVAPLRGVAEQERRAFVFPSLCLLSIAVLGGLPQISVPGATLDGLPVGLSLVGAPASDEQLLELVCALEE